jgi:uncharacterized membrane protein YbhN (UPF0104 family)
MRKILIIAALILSIAMTSCMYVATLNYLIDNEAMRWAVFFWIFGGAFVGAVFCFIYHCLRSLNKKRHATLNEKTNNIYNDLKNFFY